MNIEESFIEYKDLTLNIMEVIKVGNYEKLDEMFKQRQFVLDNIRNLDYSEKELKKLYSKYNIDKLDKILEKEIKERKEELLDKIKQNQKRKVAINGYNNLQTKAVFLSREF